MERRELLKALTALPFVGVVFAKASTEKPQTEKEVEAPIGGPLVELPISCDLSFSGLQWAFQIGEQKKFGMAKFLFIGPENKFVARELLGVPHKRYTANSEVNALYDYNLHYEVVRGLTLGTWKIVFERGTVISLGLGK